MRIIFTTDPLKDPFANLAIGADANAAVNAFIDGAIPVIVESVGNQVDRKAKIPGGEVEVLNKA